MALSELPKKTQYINVDSHFVRGTNSKFTMEIGLSSNVFVEELRDVVGVKVVDFYVTQVGENGLGSGDAAKYIDIVCPDVPTPAQILDERKGQVLARIPLECNFKGSDSYVRHDKQWKGFNRKTNYFNPIAIRKLHFELYELQGDGDYTPLQPDAAFFFTLEITTIDHEAPKPDTNLRVVDAIDKLARKVDRFNAHIKKLPLHVLEPPPPKPKIPLWYIGGGVGAIAVAYMYFFSKRQTPLLPPGPVLRAPV